MAKKQLSDRPRNGIIPTQVAKSFGFGGQQMRALYFSDDGTMLAKDLDPSTVLEYIRNNNADPRSIPMDLTKQVLSEGR